MATRTPTRRKPTGTRTISEAILEDLEKHGGSISSQALHRDMEKRYGVKHLFRARADLGRKVRTGVVHEGAQGRFWELTGRKSS